MFVACPSLKQGASTRVHTSESLVWRFLELLIVMAAETPRRRPSHSRRIPVQKTLFGAPVTGQSFCGEAWSKRKIQFFIIIIYYLLFIIHYPLLFLPIPHSLYSNEKNNLLFCCCLQPSTFTSVCISTNQPPLSWNNKQWPWPPHHHNLVIKPTNHQSYIINYQLHSTSITLILLYSSLFCMLPPFVLVFVSQAI